MISPSGIETILSSIAPFLLSGKAYLIALVTASLMIRQTGIAFEISS
ncbi:hypothetical protein [Pollutibacter soli]